MAPQLIRRISSWYKERVKITNNHIINRFFYFNLDALRRSKNITLCRLYWVTLKLRS
jgi:hypothetical protein